MACEGSGAWFGERNFPWERRSVLPGVRREKTGKRPALFPPAPALCRRKKILRKGPLRARNGNEEIPLFRLTGKGQFRRNIKPGGL